MNLPTHDAGNGLIGFRVLRNLAGDKTLNTELRIWAAVNKAGHRGNKRLSLGRRFDMGQLTSLRMTAARVAQIRRQLKEVSGSVAGCERRDKSIKASTGATLQRENRCARALAVSPPAKVAKQKPQLERDLAGAKLRT
jgi:hypothetical protein